MAVQRRVRVAVTALLAVAASVSAQTATQTQTDFDALSLIIPLACVTQCTPWQTAYAACPAAAATFETCVCEPTFQTTTETCFTCMTTELTANADAQAALPASALAGLQQFCTGVVVSSDTSSLTSSTTTTTTTPAETSSLTTSSSTATTTTPPSFTTSAFSEAAESSTTFLSENVTLVSTVQGQAFPTQTKQPSVFSGATALQVGGAAIAGLAGCMILLA